MFADLQGLTANGTNGTANGAADGGPKAKRAKLRSYDLVPAQALHPMGDGSDEEDDFDEDIQRGFAAASGAEGAEDDLAGLTWN